MFRCLTYDEIMPDLSVTPHTFVMAARVAVVPFGLLRIGCSLWVASQDLACLVTFALTSIALSAAPKTRHGDVLGLVTVAITLSDTVGASQSGSFDAARWGLSMAIVGATGLILRIQNFRGLARQDAYVPLRNLERGNAALGRTPSNRHERRPRPSPHLS